MNFSCITLMMSNEKTSSPQCEEEGPAREIYPGVAYFIVYRRSKIFSILHNADMESTVTILRTRNSASTLFQVLKDHANEAVQNLVRESNTFCFRRAITDMREQDLPAPEQPCTLLSDQGLQNCHCECHRTSNAHDGSSPKSRVGRIGCRDRIPSQRHRHNT